MARKTSLEQKMEMFLANDALGRENAALRAELAAAKAERDAMAAHVERLREALNRAITALVFADTPESKAFHFHDLVDQLRNSLATTPAQSLAAHDAALLERVKARIYTLASKEADQPYGHEMNPRQWAATCLECAAEDVAAMQEELLGEADRIEKEARHG